MRAGHGESPHKFLCVATHRTRGPASRFHLLAKHRCGRSIPTRSAQALRSCPHKAFTLFTFCADTGNRTPTPSLARTRSTIKPYPLYLTSLVHAGKACAYLRSADYNGKGSRKQLLILLCVFQQEDIILLFLKGHYNQTCARNYCGNYWCPCTRTTHR